MRILEDLAQEICCAIEHGEALYEKDMFDSLISDIQRLVDECHREFLKNQEEIEEAPAAETVKVISLKKEEPAAVKAEPSEKSKSMQVMVTYLMTGCTGYVPVTVDVDEIDLDAFLSIQTELRETFNDKNLIITNMIKLPIK